MLNPYYLYIIVFSLVLVIYQLQWSDLYPELSPSLVLFLSTTFVAFFLGGKFLYKPAVAKFYSVSYDFRVLLISYAIFAFWAMEFVYNKGIPIILIMQGSEYEYTSFGIPFFHPVIASFSSFWIVYTFHVYLSCGSRKILFLCFFNSLPHLLIFSRGAVLTNMVSCAFVYIFFISEKVNLVKFTSIVTKIMILSLTVLFAFGSLGNIRTDHAYNRFDGDPVILSVARASRGFRDSMIPAEYLWAYIYISSPIANLQATIDDGKFHTEVTNLNAIFSFVNNEIFPDFVSKRLNSVYDFTKKNPSLIDPQLTVATVYANSYVYLSWLGLFFMALFIFTVPIIYHSLLGKHHQFSLTGIAILNSLYVFLIFDNMFAFSGLSFQLIYPLIFKRSQKLELVDKSGRTYLQSNDR
jgi:hypothetical protein